MMTIPWTWFGMTTNASNRAFRKWSGIVCQHARTISPTSFNRTAPSATSPNAQIRSFAQIVTK
jgi:hypothetical protein